MKDNMHKVMRRSLGLKMIFFLADLKPRDTDFLYLFSLRYLTYLSESDRME